MTEGGGIRRRGGLGGVGKRSYLQGKGGLCGGEGEAAEDEHSFKNHDLAGCQQFLIKWKTH